MSFFETAREILSAPERQMSEAKFTQGEWIMDEAGIVASDWGLVAQVGAPEEFWGAHEDEIPESVRATILANARAIAAIPAMFSALERIKGATMASTNSGTLAEYQSWVRAVAATAIADATGVGQ